MIEVTIGVIFKQSEGSTSLLSAYFQTSCKGFKKKGFVEFSLQIFKLFCVFYVVVSILLLMQVICGMSEMYGV